VPRPTLEFTGHLMSDENDFGPLPASGRESVLEQESITALRGALPSDRFHFRGERDDFGIDGSIELRAAGRSLNMRTQVQLKGTDSVKTNADGTVSRQIKVSNLNYMLNGPSPIYVLYISSRRELRFAWAHDERNRLSCENPTWLKQDSVVIRFSRVIDSASLDEIFQRVLRESRLQRQAFEALSVASSLGRTALSIDQSTLHLMTGEQALEVVLNEGMQMVAAGRGNAVLELAGRIPYNLSGNSQLLFITGFARFWLGRFFEAHGDVARAKLHLADASPEQRAQLKYLDDSCLFQTGQITTDEYARRLNQASESANSEFSLVLRFEAQRRLSLAGGDEEHLAFGRILDEIMSGSAAGASLRAQARLAALMNTGRDLAKQVTHRLFLLQSRDAIGMSSDLATEGTVLSRLIEAWEKDAAIAISHAAIVENPGLQAYALSVRATTRLLCVSSFAAFGGQDLDDSLGKVKGDVTRALEIYRSSQDLEGELRVRMIEADVEAFCGELQSARSIATEVMDIGENIGYRAMVDAATSFLGGHSHAENIARTNKRLAETDHDILFSAESDDRLRDMAEDMLVVIGIGRDRLPNLVIDGLANRAESAVRVEWCRHFELAQDLRHTLSRETIYRDPIMWRCRCQERSIEDDQNTFDFSIAISEFKQRHCIDCVKRSPKRTVAAPEHDGDAFQSGSDPPAH